MVEWLDGFKFTKFFLFLTVLLAPLYVVRFRIGLYPSTLLEVLIGLTLLSWAVGKARQWCAATNIDLRLTINDLPIALFLIAAAVSVVVSPDKRGGLGVFKAYFVEPLLIYLVIRDVVRSKKDWWLVLGFLGLSGVWVALLAIFQGLTGGLTLASHEAALGRAHAVYNSANALGLYLGPIILLLLGVLPSYWQKLKTQNLKLQWTALFAVVVMVLAVILSKSAGALVGLVISSLFFILYSLFPRKRMIKVAGVLGLVMLVSGAWFFFNISNFTPKNVDPYVRKSADTLQFRLCLWEGTRNLLLDRPIFGAGLSGFKELYAQKYFTCDAEPLEYPHNWVLNIWVEIGALGLAAFLWLLWRYLKSVNVSVCQCVNGERTIAYCLLPIAFLAAMVYWFVHGLVDVPYFKNDLALEFWILVGLAETLGLTF